MSLDAGDAEAPTTRSTSSSRSTSARRRSSRPRVRHGHQDAPRRLPGRVARRPDDRRLAARDGRRLRDDRLRRLPQPARPRSPRSRSRTATSELPRALARVKRTKVFSDGVTSRRRRSSRRTSRAAPARARRSAARRPARPARPTTFTDAWFVGFTPRLATAVWVGYPNGADRDERPVPRRPGRRRHVPGRDLGRLHEAASRASSAATSRSRRSRSSRQPFFGQYSRSGGKGTGDGRPAAAAAVDRRRRRPPRRRPGRRPRSRTTGNGNGERQRRHAFDPDQYESPPQSRPPRSTPRGGTATAAARPRPAG